MADRQAALREALEKRETDNRKYLATFHDANVALVERECALLRFALKRLGHCNTCHGAGLVCSTSKDCKVANHFDSPCPDCVPDEAELLGEMGK